MQQIIFGVYVEGKSDERYFPTLVERYLTEHCDRKRIDVAILPPILSPRYTGGFIARMKEVEQNHRGATYIFVHADADAPNTSNVLQNKWEPWLNESLEPERWAAIIPVRMAESWMLADRNALKSAFIISDEQLDEILGDQFPESIQNPKQVLAEIQKAGKQKRLSGYEENIAQRCDFSTLERLPSFQFFQEQVARKLDIFER
ncbi:hypothetical protein BH24DEI2_BH24DEI2_28580 [soil metagenome]